MAERFLLRANDDVLNFLTAVVKGLHESGDRAIYDRTVTRYLDAGTHLAALAQQWRLSAVEDETRIKAILDKAIAREDDIAVIECVVAIITRHSEDLEPLIATCFEPGMQYLTVRNEVRWVDGAWFTSEAKTFFAQMSAATAELVLDNLMSVPRIDTHAEWILAYIARGHAAAVWSFLGCRILEDQHGRDRRADTRQFPINFTGYQKFFLKTPPRPFESRAACTRRTTRSFSFAARGYPVRCSPHFPRTWLAN